MYTKPKQQRKKEKKKKQTSESERRIILIAFIKSGNFELNKVVNRIAKAMESIHKTILPLPHPLNQGNALNQRQPLQTAN